MNDEKAENRANGLKVGYIVDGEADAGIKFLIFNIFANASSSVYYCSRSAAAPGRGGPSYISPGRGNPQPSPCAKDEDSTKQATCRL